MTTAVAPYLDRAKWGEERFPRIGSSDVGAILGLDEYRTAGDVWDRIVLGEHDDSDGADARRGRKFESAAVETFVERFPGVRVRRCPMRMHPEHDFMVTDVDRLIESMPEWPESLAALMAAQSGPGSLEVKVPRVANFYRMREEGLPLKYIVQHQHQMGTTGWGWGVFAFYTPEYDDVIAFPVLRDSEFIELMNAQLVDWWNTHIFKRVRPERPMPAPARWPAKVPGQAFRMESPEWEEAVLQLVDAKADLERATMHHEDAERALLTLLPADQPLVAGAGATVKRYSTLSQRRFDAKAFKAAVLLAQREGDADTLFALDPNDDAFHFQTQPSDKVDVRLVAAKAAEEAA